MTTPLDVLTRTPINGVRHTDGETYVTQLSAQGLLDALEEQGYRIERSTDERPTHPGTGPQSGDLCYFVDGGAAVKHQEPCIYQPGAVTDVLTGAIIRMETP